MILRYKFCMVIFMVLLCYTPLQAEVDSLKTQDNNTSPHNHFANGINIWIGFSFGPNIFSRCGLEVAQKNVVAGFHRNYVGNDEFLDFDSPSEYSISNSVYIGKRLSGKFSALHLTAGFGAVEMRRRTEQISSGWLGGTYESIKIHTVGIDLGFNLAFTVRNNGAGIRVNANLNPYDPFMSWCVFVQTGWNW